MADARTGRMCRGTIEQRTVIAEGLKPDDADGERSNADPRTGDEHAHELDQR